MGVRLPGSVRSTSSTPRRNDHLLRSRWDMPQFACPTEYPPLALPARTKPLSPRCSTVAAGRRGEGPALSLRESLLSFFRMHWDPEPGLARSAGWKACATFRFMESPLGLTIVHWDPEPLAVPRRTKSADKSDALQTLRAIRRRPAVAKRLECVRLQRRFPKAGCNSMAGQVHGEPPRL